MSNETTYKQLSQIDHVLHRPDTYVGSLNKVTTDAYVVEPDTMKIVKKSVTYSPAFLKIFDEVLTNASDQCQRDGTKVSYIKVNVSDSGKISVENDGKSLPIEIHKDLGCYIPEMTFTRLLTGSNYNDDEERFGAGRNGLGSKLANIYSSKFIIETADGKKSYRQVCHNNMNVVDKPEISVSNTSMTRISFFPEFHRFGMKGMESDALSLIIKRTLDVAAYNPGINVFFNNKPVTIKSFEEYVRLHVAEDEEIFIEKLNDRFEIAVVKSSTGQFEQISIVNGVSTFEGGTHTYWASYTIANSVFDSLAKGKRIKMKWQDVKNNMMLFMLAKVPNPSFPSQTKEKLATPMTKEILMGAMPSDKFLKKIQRSEIVEELLRQIDARDKADLSKMVKPVTGRIRVEKLEDANKAGTKDSTKCSLILCEGDSAKGMAVAGFSIVGRDYYGVFPLKGKVLNVRDAAADKIRDNAEIAKILTILGLVPGKKYKDLSELRYGKVIFMTDQDHDGTHIKGLLLNAFHFFWPELLKFDFIYEFITPIVKARKGKLIRSYYRLSDYVKDKTNLGGWTTKYYKGLGTSTAKESKEYFEDLPKHLLPIRWDKDTDYSITKAFSNKLANLRKDWILNHVQLEYDKFGVGQTITQFVDRELVEFSTADLNRSIPDVVDGLKPSTRKILYTFLDNNVKGEVKTADISGVISSKTAYHHGAGSLEGGIVGLAQDFVGSNNINILEPIGMFGTRTQGGKDHASSRYTFTSMTPLTRLIFRPEDDDILDFLDDDGKQIEPERYYPIIPMVLVNGAAGIGTGWSTDIEKYNPRDIIDVLKKVLKSKSAVTKKMFSIKPYYQGFNGSIHPSINGHLTRGVYNILKGNKIQVTELPVGVWTDNFILHLDKLLDNKIKVGKGKEMKEVASPLIKSYTNNSTDDTVNVTVTLIDDHTKTNVNKLLSLEALHATSNMHCFSESKVQKYELAEDIFVDFYEQRLLAYEWRKAMMLHLLTEKVARLRSIHEYVTLVIAKKVLVVGETLERVEEQLTKHKVAKIEESYGHLHRLQIQSVTTKRAEEIKQEYLAAELEYKKIDQTLEEDLWLSDLVELEKKLTQKK